MLTAQQPSGAQPFDGSLPLHAGMFLQLRMQSPRLFPLLNHSTCPPLPTTASSPLSTPFNSSLLFNSGKMGQAARRRRGRTGYRHIELILLCYLSLFFFACDSLPDLDVPVVRKKTNLLQTEGWMNNRQPMKSIVPVRNLSLVQAACCQACQILKLQLSLQNKC